MLELIISLQNHNFPRILKKSIDSLKIPTVAISSLVDTSRAFEKSSGYDMITAWLLARYVYEYVRNTYVYTYTGRLKTLFRVF